MVCMIDKFVHYSLILWIHTVIIKIFYFLAAKIAINKFSTKNKTHLLLVQLVQVFLPFWHLAKTLIFSQISNNTLYSISLSFRLIFWLRAFISLSFISFFGFFFGLRTFVSLSFGLILWWRTFISFSFSFYLITFKLISLISSRTLASTSISVVRTF